MTPELIVILGLFQFVFIVLVVCFYSLSYIFLRKLNIFFHILVLMSEYKG